jgi:hypothetical protein
MAREIGMTAAAWREAVVAYIRAETLPLDKFGHMPRLYALAVRLGQGTEYDDDVLFGVAIDAQAGGDLAVLESRGRRALRVHLGADVAAGLKTLAAAVDQALA